MKKIIILLVVFLVSVSLFADFSLGFKATGYKGENVKGAFYGLSFNYAQPKDGIRFISDLGFGISPRAQYRNDSSDEWVISQSTKGSGPRSYRTYMFDAKLGIEYYKAFANGYTGGGALYVSARDVVINNDGETHPSYTDWGRQSFLTYGIGGYLNFTFPSLNKDRVNALPVSLSLRPFFTLDLAGISWKTHSVSGKQSSFGQTNIKGGVDYGVTICFTYSAL